MQILYLCEMCQRAYAPKITNGVKKLKEFRGYMVDLRLEEFRKVVEGQGITFISFTSAKGQELLQQMHQEVMQ
jgi:hypothetical protein